MRNVKVYSVSGVALEVGTAKLAPRGITVIQEDQLTPQFLKEHGEFIAIASMDNVLERRGDQVNEAFLATRIGWHVPNFKEEKVAAKPLPPPIGTEDLVPREKPKGIVAPPFQRESVPENPPEEKKAVAPPPESVDEVRDLAKTVAEGQPKKRKGK